MVMISALDKRDNPFYPYQYQFEKSCIPFQFIQKNMGLLKSGESRCNLVNLIVYCDLKQLLNG